MKTIKIALAMITTSALLACGGGGGGSGPISFSSAADEVVLLAGTGTVVDGTIDTSRYLLKSMAWQISALSPTDPDLSLKNQTCDAVTKHDAVDTLVPGAGIGQSTWTCSLGVISTANVKTDAVYKLLLVGIDSAGQSSTFTKQLRVQPNPNFSNVGGGGVVTVAVAGGLVGKPGQTLNLGALAESADATAAKSTSFVYSWSLGVGSEKFATLLSSTGSNVQLYLLPGQTTPATVTMTVTATGNGAGASSTVYAMVDPFGPLGPSVSPAVQDVPPNGQVCIRAKDIDISDPNLFYQWSVTQVNGVDVVPGVTVVPPLGGANTLNVGFFAPPVPQLLTIRFAVGYQPINPPAIAVNPIAEPYTGVYSVDALVRVTNTPTASVFNPLDYCRDPKLTY